MVDLIVRNARLLDGRLLDIAVEGTRFARIGPSLDLDAAKAIDAEGRLVTAPLVDCHLHLDASLTAGTSAIQRERDADRGDPGLGRAEADADRAGRL